MDMRESNAETDSEKIKDLEQENEQLLAQLHQVQEELEIYYLENKEIEKKLHLIYNSTSWKITAPLRTVARSLKLRRRTPFNSIVRKVTAPLRAAVRSLIRHCVHPKSKYGKGKS